MRISDWSSDVCSSDLGLITDCERSSPQLPRLGYSPGLPCHRRQFCSSVEFPVRTLPYPPQYWFSAVARKHEAGIAFVSSPFPHPHTVTRARHLGTVTLHFQVPSTPPTQPPPHPNP